MFASASGIIHFHPRSISWSKRKRGNVARNQMYMSMNIITFVMKMIAPSNPPHTPCSCRLAVVMP